eukprot:CAMPEP_0172539858 /NCGR_PEP_ID=MMETSP1067-20121228/10976_1 /TAXON_ID=265564 ORGANISM="Thalassiosira punctigera, Strain Tpunct2005C2" /NCGR_SAMPLE_ID=MMETSP1067 /ASSEMBLY_ACC=CAM_ASM_000444 /LENGTH=30 /DNA_ID= /DNA_START= /DNA_END= /DNA_ORIENTATION=
MKSPTLLLLAAATTTTTSVRAGWIDEDTPS